eukprot:CAMPEP_0206528956 /NCGR_PEP_ID=MMETSP0325_2-20121206/2302_1 /ASSEMBLY_ACC=CAM_ASM_000347 /TAXON_ID=2866 /ORGANISM="Crypthecodinium cohnii, Strain Seligo" /LENGTH=33 /DNA_ID= /DNA_START= /DNA_END= /DNA_ORIENTATION=
MTKTHVHVSENTPECLHPQKRELIKHNVGQTLG